MRPVVQRLVVAGREILVCRPMPSVLVAHAGHAVQPPLPTEPPPLPPPPPTIHPDADRLAHAMARVVWEVVCGRRPPAQLADVLPEEAHREILAWRRHGPLPLTMGRPRLSAISPSSVEGWLPVVTAERPLAAAIHLQHEGGVWRCREFHLLAPASWPPVFHRRHPAQER